VSGAEQTAWLARPEKGSRLGMRIVLGVVRATGRTVGQRLVDVIAFYYVLFAPRARRASNAYTRRLLGRGGFWSAYRHIRQFAACTLDRLFLLGGRLDLFEFERTGSQHLVALTRARRGALLLGAHLGSYEAMRAISEEVKIRINILAHFENAARITTFLEEASGGDPMLRVVPVDPKDPTYILRIKTLIEDGELVAMLGDRVGVNEKVVRARFLGDEAAFPAGPFVIAALLGCPVLLVFGLFHRPNRYALYCEPFCERVELPRRARGAALVEHAQRYADRLEHHCRLAPDNWFNFYDFWGSETETRA
jgi:predicted LPLAT superfamily acyltransferase